MCKAVPFLHLLLRLTSTSGPFPPLTGGRGQKEPATVRAGGAGGDSTPSRGPGRGPVGLCVCGRGGFRGGAVRRGSCSEVTGPGSVIKGRPTVAEAAAAAALSLDRVRARAGDRSAAALPSLPVLPSLPPTALRPPVLRDTLQRRGLG